MEKMWKDETITAEKAPALFADMESYISEYEANTPFIPGQTNITAYINLLLDKLYKRYFRPDNYVHGKPHTKLDLSDPDLIVSTWEFYRGICLRYGGTCTVQRFCVFVGMNRETLDTWQNGEYRTTAHSNIVKMFKQQSESDLLSRAIEGNSIGSIFALKAGFGYNDNQPQTLTVKRDDMPQLTQEEIRQRLELMEDE